MEVILKQRLIGAAVIIALAVVLVPMILDGAGKHQRPLIPEVPKQVSSQQYKRIQVVHKLSPTSKGEIPTPSQYVYYGNNTGKASEKIDASVDTSNQQAKQLPSDSDSKQQKVALNKASRQGQRPGQYGSGNDPDEDEIAPPQFKIIKSNDTNMRNDDRDNGYSGSGSDNDYIDYQNGKVEWTVQIASFRNKRNADLLKRKLTRAGFNAYIQLSRNYPGRRVYRVRVGPEPDRRSARAVLYRVRDVVQLNGYITRYR